MTPARILLVLIIAGAVPPSANAALYNLAGTIDGAQAAAGAGTGSQGTGTITGTYDDTSGIMDWNIAWSGLLGSATVMHFHGPALPNQNAGVQVDFGAISGTSSPSVGSTSISASQGDDLVDDLWYVNIHTSTSPGGEIRGQVNATLVPEPSTALLVSLATGLLLRRRRS